MRSRTTVGAGAATLLLLGALTGCGGSDGGAKEPAAAPPSRAPRPSAGAAATASEGATVAGGLSRSELVAAIRSATSKQRSSHVTMDMNTSAGALSAEGDVSYGPGASDMRMTMQMPTGRMEMRLVDGVLYLSMPPMTPEGKFLKVDPQDAGGPFAGMFAGIDRQLDPSSTFGAFEKGLRKVDYLGQESVDGEDLGHYVLTVETRRGLQALGQQVPGDVPRTMTYDLWLDSDNLVRRMQMQLSGLSMDMSMSRWGEKVQVSAPPPGAIVSAPAG